MHSHPRPQTIQRRLLRFSVVCLLLAGLNSCDNCEKQTLDPKASPQKLVPSHDPRLGGIPNVGNTCFLNSVMQIFAKLYPTAFKGNSDAMAQAGQKIVDKIEHDQEAVTTEEAKAFYQAFLALANQKGYKFTKDSQEDAHEVLQLLLGVFNFPQASTHKEYEDITPRKGGSTKPYFPSSGSDDFFNIYQLKPNNQGSADMQQLLEVPLQSATREIDDYRFTQEKVNPSNTNQKTDIESKYPDYTVKEYKPSDISKPAQWLVKGKVRITEKLGGLTQLKNSIMPIQVVRSLYGNNKGQKDTTLIKQPMHLTISSKCLVKGSADMKYDLAGFISHRGDTLDSGHYIAYVDIEGQWKCYNDSSVTLVTPADAEKAAEQAYIYFYKPTS